MLRKGMKWIHLTLDKVQVAITWVLGDINSCFCRRWGIRRWHN